MLYKKISKMHYRCLSVLTTCIGKISLKLKGVVYGSGLKVRGLIYIDNGGIINIGSSCRINSSIWANPTAGVKTTFRVFKGGKIIIGNNCGISNTSFASAKEILIGNSVMIGAGCCIWDTDFHIIKTRDTVTCESCYSPCAKSIYIGDGAFIGGNSIILKGVKIGKNSVVGAGSVVTRDIPDGEIWAGNPVRRIK